MLGLYWLVRQNKSRRLKGIQLNTPKSFISKKCFEISEGVQRSPNFYVARREAIRYTYILFGSPCKEDLEDGEVVREIMRRLNIPNGSRELVEDLLENIRINELDNTSFCGKR